MNKNKNDKNVSYKISHNHLSRQEKAFGKNQDPLLQKTYSANKK